jgi:hypothetical protein
MWIMVDADWGGWYGRLRGGGGWGRGVWGDGGGWWLGGGMVLDGWVGVCIGGCEGVWRAWLVCFHKKVLIHIIRECATCRISARDLR